MTARVFSESRSTRATDRRVLRQIQHRKVFTRGESVVAGVSGGPDSAALLLILARLRAATGLTLEVAHFDHRLRSREETEGDRAFVEALCRRLDVPFVAGGGDVAARARRQRESVEEAARVLRYRFLGREARRVKATAVAVGHTMDDRAETVLLHIIRGSGLDGLAAMPPRAPWPFGKGPDVVRPLIELRRADTERYCSESGVEPRRDPTNDLPIATRNRLRQELMPVLRTFNPRIEEALARLAQAAGRDLAFVESFFPSAWRLSVSRDRGGLAIDRRSLERWDLATTSRLIRRAAAEVSVGEPDLKWEDVDRVLKSLSRQRARTPLPGGLTAQTDPHTVTIWPGDPPKPPAVPHVAIVVPGITKAGKWTIEARFEDNHELRLLKDEKEAVLDERASWFTPKVRSRQPGDRLRPLGLGGTKKVQDILVDAKVPEGERDEVPIIADEKGIIWVVGHCIDERVAVGPETKRVLRLRARRAGRKSGC